jgi:peptidyl-prolyl cis-trans isomerase D
MRKHAKSWLIKFLIAIIALVFIFYFGYSFRAKQGLKIALVNGEVISGLEYQNAYWDLLEGLRRQYQNVWDDNLIKVFDLKNRALDNLINQKLISQEARRLGLEVTESEIQEAIMDYAAFQINGQFDLGRYRAVLDQNRMTTEDFEDEMAKELLAGKLRQFLFAFMTVTDQEVLDQYTYANEKRKISFVHFKHDEFRKSIQPDQTAMEDYFEARKEAYRVPEKIKIAYLLIDPADFADQVELADREIEAYYEYNVEAFKEPKQVKARHILFKLREDASEQEEKTVREKAEKVLKEARENGDFAALAKKYSEGPTKDNGGDLGYFTEGRMVKPFEEVAFQMKKGEISDLVRTPFGYHIIYIEDIREERTKPLDEVREEISNVLLNNAGTELAHERALSLIDQMPYDKALEAYAAENDLEAKYTEYFSQDQPIPGIGGDQKLRQTLFSFEKGQSSEVLEIDGKFYIIQVADRQPSYLPEMKEVESKLREDFAAHLAAEAAKGAAQKFLAELNAGKAWDELAEQNGVETQSSDFFTRTGSVADIGYLPDLQEIAFSLNKAEPYAEKVLENEKGAFVIRWEAKQGIDQTKYKKEKEDYRFSLMQSKHRQAFGKWVESLKESAEIKIVNPVT